MTVTEVCDEANMSRQNYYKQRKKRHRQRLDEDLILQLVKEERKLHPRMGGRKLLVRIRPELKKAGTEIGRDRFFDLLRAHGKLVAPKRLRLTLSRHAYRVYPNGIRDLEIDRAHQVWVSDITYIATDEGHEYLALIMDAYTRKIVGYYSSDNLQAEGTIQALRQALKQLPEGCYPIHHSDRGSQYCCHDYVDILKQRQLSISMTEQNHCYENAQAERLNGILKHEYGLATHFKTRKQARKAIAQAVLLYNQQRPHLALDYRTPSEVHRSAA